MEVYKKLFKYIPEKRHLIVLSSVLSVLSVIFRIGSYWFLWQFLYSLIAERNIPDGVFYAFVIVGCVLIGLLCRSVAVWLSHIFAFRLESNLRLEGVKRLLAGSFAFYDTHQSGRVRKIIDDNTAKTHEAVAHLIPDMASALVTPIMIFIVVFSVDWKLGLLTVIVSGLSLLLMGQMMGDRGFMDEYNRSLERMSSETVEYVRGIQVLKIFGTTIESFTSFYNAIVEYGSKSLAYTFSCRLPYITWQALLLLTGSLTVPLGATLIAFGYPIATMVTEVVFYLGLSGLFFVALNRIMYASMHVHQAKTVIDTLETLFDEMAERKIAFGNEATLDKHDITFDKVCFKYDSQYILKDFSLHLAANKVYALVGSSGGGKSTIAKLISGFYPLESGTLLLGDKPIQAYQEATLMKNIAFVFQNAHLFKTSIFENVRMGNTAADDGAVMKALEDACCTDILDKFPQREHTIIGSQGVYLSGGEIQRIAIARALLKDAPIIILDEASAAADPENEWQIQKAFARLMHGKTVIMIAHRLTSIRNVDEILVVEDGRVVEQGSHEQLMAVHGRYAHLQALYAQANAWKVKE